MTGTLQRTKYNTRQYWLLRIDRHATSPRELRYDRAYLDMQAKLAEQYGDVASYEFWSELEDVAHVAVDALPERMSLEYGGKEPA